jgi:AraC-like DNA-binding protein
MDLDTRCIPLGHIQTYFDLRKALIPDANWLQKRSQHVVHNPHEILEMIIGIDQQDFYRNAGIDYRPGDSGVFISTRQVLDLVDQAVLALEMPYLGLAMGNLMTITHHGMAGVAAISQPTLKGCLETVARFCQELFPPLEMYGRVDAREACFGIEPNLSLAPYTHFFLELNMVSFYNIFRQLTGGEHELTRVEFSYAEPEWSPVYRRYFRCPVVFGAAETRLVGAVELADYEMPMANRLMAMAAEKTLFENIPTRAIRLLPLRLRRLLVRYYGAFPSLENAASELGMSGRTLRRKLAEEGTTYQRELDAVRQKIAEDYFSRGGTSVTELSLSLGFADSSAFAKAFRRWTGLAPTEYLERLRTEAGAAAHPAVS